MKAYTEVSFLSIKSNSERHYITKIKKHENQGDSGSSHISFENYLFDRILSFDKVIDCRARVQFIMQLYETLIGNSSGRC